MPDAIALFSSSRRNGNTGQLMDRIATELGIEVVDLATMNLSVYDYEHRNRNDDFEPPMKRPLSFDQLPSFMHSFLDTFSYLGMKFGGVAHANCRDGDSSARHDAEAVAFPNRVRSAAHAASME